MSGGDNLYKTCLKNKKIGLNSYFWINLAPCFYYHHAKNYSNSFFFNTLLEEAENTPPPQIMLPEFLVTAEDRGKYF